MLVSLSLVAFALGSSSGCPLPRSSAELAEIAGLAETTWGRDATAFTEAVAAVDLAIPCVIEVLPALSAARVHRLHGLSAFLRREPAAAAASFAAARSLDPAYTFPESFVPAGNPVDTLYRNALAPADVARFEAPRAGWQLWVDGTASVARNNAVPVVAQVIDPVGRVHDGAWVAEYAKLPPYPTWREGLRGPLVAVGASAVVAGAGLWALGAATRPEPATLLTVSDGESAELRQAVIGGSAIGLVGIGLGTITLGFGVGRW